MPLLHYNFRRFLNTLDALNPAQIEDAQTKILDLRRKTEAISEIEARTNQQHKCPFCGDERRQKWGRTGTKVQHTDAPAVRRPIRAAQKAPSAASIVLTCSWLQ